MTAVGALLVAYGDVIRTVLIALPMIGTIAVFALVFYRVRQDHVREWFVLRLLRVFRCPFVLLPYYEADGPIIAYIRRIPEKGIHSTRYRAELSPAVQAWADFTQTRIRLPIQRTNGTQIRLLRFDSHADKVAFLMRWRGEGKMLTP